MTLFTISAFISIMAFVIRRMTKARFIRSASVTPYHYLSDVGKWERNVIAIMFIVCAISALVAALAAPSAFSSMACGVAA